MDRTKGSRELRPVVVLIVIGILYLLPYLRHPEIGYDTPAHLSTGVYLSRHLPYVGWNREMFFGMPFLLNYPPFAYYTIALFSLILPPMTVFSLLFLVAFVLNPLILYLLLREWGFNKTIAFASALLLLTTWPYLGSVYIMGQLPYSLGCALVLSFFLSLERAKSIRGEIICGMVLAAAIYTHLLASYFLFIMLMLYTLINPKKVPFKDLARSLRLIILIGFGASSLFWAPFLTSFLIGGPHLIGDFGQISSSIEEIFLALPSTFYSNYFFIGYPMALLLFTTIYSVCACQSYRRDWHLITAGAWFSVFLIIPMRKAFSGGVEIPKCVFFLAISGSIFSAYGLRFLYDKNRKVVYALMVGFLIFGSVGTYKMVKSSPFYTLDENAREIAGYLDPVVNDNEIIIIKDTLVGLWFNTFTDITQSTGVSNLERVNSQLLYSLASANPGGVKSLMRDLGIRYLVVPATETDAYLKEGFVDVFHTSSTYLPPHILLLEGIEPSFAVGKNLIIKSLTYDDPDHISIQFKALEKGSKALTVRTSYHRGWHAYLDGKSIPVQKSEHGFIELYPDAVGEHKIELKYYLWERRIGFAMTYLSLVAVMGYYVLKLRESRV